ncbi:hypothetical protein DYB39_03365 [Providencia rettgeri]|nr:hypothetical protein AM461_10055 [Providencia rettgeri]RFT12174.1 hypothetical protein DYB39_03365 [Providencia rettgeri]
MCWLHKLTLVTYLCMLLGLNLLAAFLQLELFRVYSNFRNRNIQHRVQRHNNIVIMRMADEAD